MLRRVWQCGMIALARSARVTRFMQENRATSFLRRRYVAGESHLEGCARAMSLMQEDGIRASLFFAGEYVKDPELVLQTVRQKQAVAAALGAQGLDVHVSVDPTQIGQMISPDLVEEQALRLAEGIAALTGAGQGVHCLMLDMEDASLNDPTIALHDRLQDRGLPVALTLQAYLHRSEADLARQIQRGSRVRLVKGAFAAGPDLALQGTAEIKRNSRRLIAMMFSQEARERGFYPIIATHDERLQRFAMDLARQNGWAHGDYEFEMLLGVRETLARDLARRGERVRLYLPFGQDWWPHAVRRIGENPRNLLLLVRALLS